jgi:hypothetical protein
MGWFDGYQAFGGGTGVGRFQMSLRFIDAPFSLGLHKMSLIFVQRWTRAWSL